MYYQTSSGILFRAVGGLSHGKNCLTVGSDISIVFPSPLSEGLWKNRLSFSTRAWSWGILIEFIRSVIFGQSFLVIMDVLIDTVGYNTPFNGLIYTRECNKTWLAFFGVVNNPGFRVC
jgi:hypothetical protein